MIPEKPCRRLPEWGIAVLITAAALWLHVHFWLEMGGLWRDEVNLVNLSAQHSLAAMEKDSFPLLMPLAVHAWLAAGMGNNDLTLRLFGLAVGAGILAALWISSWKIRRSPPLLSLVLFGLNSSLIFFGDSLRAYGLGSLLAAALTASAFAFLQETTRRRALWLGLWAVLSVQVLYHNAVLVAAICFGLWAVCLRRKNGRMAIQVLAVAVVAAASLLPYAQNLFSAAGSSDVLRTGVKLPRFFASYTDTLGYPRSGYIYAWVIFYAGIVVSAVPVLRGKLSAVLEAGEEAATGDFSLFAAVALTLATVGFPIFFWRAQLPMQSWYVLPFMAFAAVCFDAALPAFRGFLRAAVWLFVAATAVISVPATANLLNGHFSDVNLYAQALEMKAGPKDYIVVEPWLFGITFDHYFKSATPWDTLPPLSDHATHRFDLVQAQLQNTNAIAPLLRKMAETLQAGHRVWIVAAKGWMGVPGPGLHPPASLPPAPLPDTGWADWPYTRVWAAQVACFLADHSHFHELKSLSNDRYITEDMTAFVADGWKTNSAAP